jgi:predicted RND superfamily exporter protein
MKNKEVFWLSIIALVCIIFAFFIHWILFLPAVIIMIKNKKTLGLDKKIPSEVEEIINKKE